MLPPLTVHLPINRLGRKRAIFGNKSSKKAHAIRLSRKGKTLL
jgi:hypothetical protein